MGCGINEFSLLMVISEEEEGKDIYCYIGDVCLTNKSVENFGRKVVRYFSGISLDESEGNTEKATRNSFKWYIRLYKPVNMVL